MTDGRRRMKIGKENKEKKEREEGRLPSLGP